MMITTERIFLNGIDLTKIREKAAKIKTEVGAMKLYGQLPDMEAESILKDADTILQEAARDLFSPPTNYRWIKKENEGFITVVSWAD
jgi:hypothetical protein